MRRMTYVIAVLALVLTTLGVLAQDTPKFRSTGESAGLPARYRVTLALQSGDDLEVVSRQLAATHKGRLEPYAEEGLTGFAIVLTDTRARLLSTDPRVLLVEEMAAPPVSPQPPSMALSRPPTEIATNAIPGFGSYAYDGSGNITSIGDTSSSDNFVYDRFGRLESATLRGEPCKVLTAGQPCRTEKYTYDRYGNIVTTVTARPGSDPPITRDLQPDDETNRITGTDVVYDSRGNLTQYRDPLSGDLRAFTYDGLDMMTGSEMGGVLRMYVYSATDERVVTVGKVGGSITGSDWSIRDASGRVLRRLTRSSTGTFTWSEDYIYRGGQLLSAEVPGPEKVRNFHLDHLGTPRLVTGNGGVQIAEHHYRPFGPETSSSTWDGEKAQFTGHERDTATLDYMHARYYEPFMGRFLSVDPGKDWNLAAPQSWNLYTYVRDNPINATDPDGRKVYSTGRLVTVTQMHLAVSVGLAMNTDSTGNASLTLTLGAGVSTKASDMTLQGTAAYSLVDTVEKLKGTSVAGSGEVGPWGIEVAVDPKTLKPESATATLDPVAFITGGARADGQVGVQTTLEILNARGIGRAFAYFVKKLREEKEKLKEGKEQKDPKTQEPKPKK